MKRTALYTAEHTALTALLRDLRLEAGLTQHEVSDRLERPQNYVSQLEIGGRGLNVLHIRQLVLVYGLSFPAFAEKLEERLASPPYRPPRRVRADKKK